VKDKGRGAKNYSGVESLPHGTAKLRGTHSNLKGRGSGDHIRREGVFEAIKMGTAIKAGRSAIKKWREGVLVTMGD